MAIGPSSSADRSSARRGSSEPRAPSVRVHWGVGLRCRGLFLRPRRRPFVIGMPPNRSPRSNVALQCICAHQSVHEGWCSSGVWSVLIRTLGRRRLANWGVPVENHCSSRPKGSSTSKQSTEAVHPNLRHWANQRLPVLPTAMLRCAAEHHADGVARPLPCGARPVGILDVVPSGAAPSLACGITLSPATLVYSDYSECVVSALEC